MTRRIPPTTPSISSAVVDDYLSALFWRNHQRFVGFAMAWLVLAATGTACLAAGYVDAAAGFALASLANALPAVWYRGRARLLTHLRFDLNRDNEGINR